MFQGLRNWWNGVDDSATTPLVGNGVGGGNDTPSGGGFTLSAARVAAVNRGLEQGNAHRQAKRARSRRLGCCICLVTAAVVGTIIYVAVKVSQDSDTAPVTPPHPPETPFCDGKEPGVYFDGVPGEQTIPGLNATVSWISDGTVKLCQAGGSSAKELLLGCVNWVSDTGAVAMEYMGDTITGKCFAEGDVLKEMQDMIKGATAKAIEPGSANVTATVAVEFDADSGLYDASQTTLFKVATALRHRTAAAVTGDPSLGAS